jgi:hypothetical protein
MAVAKTLSVGGPTPGTVVSLQQTCECSVIFLILAAMAAIAAKTIHSVTPLRLTHADSQHQFLPASPQQPHALVPIRSMLFVDLQTQFLFSPRREKVAAVPKAFGPISSRPGFESALLLSMDVRRRRYVELRRY